VMAIDRSFEAAFMKAIRGLESKSKDLRHSKMQALDDDGLRSAIGKPTDERLWALADGLRRGWGVDEVNRISHVDRWFLRKIQTLIDMETRLVAAAGQSEGLSELVEEAFLLGFPSPTLRNILGPAADAEIERQKVMPVFKMVDTCAGEFESGTPYYYGTFEQEDDAVTAR